MTLRPLRFFARIRSWFVSARGWLAGIRLFFDPSKLDMVFTMDRDLDEDAMAERIADLRSHDVQRAALDARRRLDVDLDRLRALPEGTLGRSYAEFLAENGLDPKDIPTLPANDDAEFVSAHLYETHDLWHVVTGFRSDVAGELGVQAVYAAQFGGKLARVLVGGGLLQSAILAPGDFARRLDAVVEGWRVGREADDLFGVPWQDLWDRPLDDVRRDLNVRVA
jgi:ubiquinone biosynthesis protein Coq4